MSTWFIKINLSNILVRSTTPGSEFPLLNSIARSLGLHDFYLVGLWNFCEGYTDECVPPPQPNPIPHILTIPQRHNQLQQAHNNVLLQPRQDPPLRAPRRRHHHPPLRHRHHPSPHPNGLKRHVHPLPRRHNLHLPLASPLAPLPPPQPPFLPQTPQLLGWLRTGDHQLPRCVLHDCRGGGGNGDVHDHAECA